MTDTHKLDRKSIAYIYKIISSLQLYCYYTKSWPTQVHKPKNASESVSRRLSRWLKETGYTSDKEHFKYKDLVMPDNTSVLSILDNLYSKYYVPPKTTEDHIKDLTSDIVMYCENYNAWPKLIKNPKNPREELSNRLASWLAKSHYLSASDFKYSSVIYTADITVKEALDYFYLYFGYHPNVTNKFDYFSHLKSAYSSSISKMLDLIISLGHASNIDIYNENLNNIAEIIDQEHLNITISEILFILSQPPTDQVLFYKREIMLNPDSKLVKLYTLLLRYTLVTINAKKETFDIIKPSCETPKPVQKEQPLKSSLNLSEVPAKVYELYEKIILAINTSDYLMLLELENKINNLFLELNLPICFGTIYMHLILPSEKQSRVLYEMYIKYSLANNNHMACLYRLLYEYRINNSSLDEIFVKH